MPYSGSGKNPYWLTLTYGGVANPAAATENIPVVADSVTTYSLTVSAMWKTTTNNISISVVFYDATNTPTGTVTSSGLSVTNSAIATYSTTPTAAPANSSYLIASISENITNDTLQVFQGAVQTGSNTAQPAIVNQNYAFVSGFSPWIAVNSALLGWEFDPLTSADGDYDSLVIDDLIELMGGQPGVQSAIPELIDPASGRGAIFRIPYTGGNIAISTGGTTGAYDLGAPQPTTDAVESLLLDGERPFGYRASNRTLTIPVLIFAPTLNTMAAARELLMHTIDQQTWKLTWKAASSGLPMEFDCFRAEPSVITYGFQNNAEGENSPWYANWAKTLVTLTFQALPYTHSGLDGTYSAVFAQGLLGGGTYVPTQQIENFSTVSGTGWTKNTAYAFGGSLSARYQAPVPIKSPYPAAVYAASITSTNITGLNNLTLWFGQSYDTQWPVVKNYVSNVTLSWTLTDVNGHTLSFSGKMNKCPWGSNPNQPAWSRINASVPQGKKKSVFDYTQVTHYSVRITNWSGSGTSGYVRMHAWMSQISAISSTTQWITTPHGAVYSVFGQSNMARTPITAEVQLPAVGPITHEYTKTNSFTVPKGVTSVFAESFGAGGGGGSVAAASGGISAGGGGGGEYAADTVTVIPGTLVPFTIGAGGTGGQVVAATATFGKPGANTWTCPPGVTVITVTAWGGGAAGGSGAGGGGGGAYTLGTVNVTAGKTYTFTVGAGGKPNTGKLSKDQAARHGGDTVVRGDTGSIHAHGGSSPVTGGTNGGTGGARVTSAEAGTTITVATNGGNGGNSPGGAGGGGGASGGSAANGNRGGDSPKGSNNYGTGGPGAVGAGGGGSGGKGADVSGTPVQGVIPGGGGGGGYTKSTNYNGAYGANGLIVVSYQENLGNPVNGTDTAFGATGLTSKTVRGHGGSSPSINSPEGAAGGTGSANTVHFNGGKGAMSGNNNDYLYSIYNGGGAFTKLAVAGTNGAASLTTGASAAAQTTGVVVASIMSTTVLDPQAVVSDSAGNIYDFVSSVTIFSTTMLYVYAAKIGNPVTTSTTLTVANNGVSALMSVQWLGSVYYADIDFATVQTGTGSSTAPGITTIANADLGVRKGYMVITGNTSAVTVSGAPAVPAGWATSTQSTSEYAFGAFTVDALLKEVPGSGSSTSGCTATYGSSAPWGAISVPLIPQDVANPAPMAINGAGGVGTTSAISLTGAYAIAANSGYMMWWVGFAGTPGTVSFTDASGNTWSQVSTVTIGSSAFRVYAAKVTNAYTTSSTITLNDTTSQNHDSLLFYVPGAQGIDSGLTKTATGTSANPSIVTNAPAQSGSLQFVVYANNNGVHVTSTPTGYVYTGSGSATMTQDGYTRRTHGKSTYTAASTYAASQTWAIVAFGFTTSVLSGSGGAAGGPLGTGQDGTDDGGSGWSGGGKGASGLTGSVGAGIDASIPGGGGSGAASSDTSDFQSGTGAAGMLRLTWQPPLTTFNDFILHRPGQGSKANLCPIISIPPNDPPDNREYNVPSLIPGVNAEFRGTYTVLVVANAWNTATTGVSRRVSVTINQYEYQNGPVVSVQATRVLTPATDIVNGYVTMGEVTLPIKDYDQANSQVFYTVSVHDTDQGDSFQDVLLLDTSGQTVLCNIAPGTAADGQYSSFYVDEPSFDRALGQVLGSQQGHEVSISVLDMTLLTGGPLYLDAGENLLLAYSTSGVPNLGVTSSPRWFTDRLV